MKEISIGKAAQATGVKVPTIRYYEEIGLLPPAPRTGSNRRLYGELDLDRLRFIRRARELGFEVGAIVALLKLQSKPETSCTSVDIIARERLAEVDRRIANLQALKRDLQRMIRRCGRERVSDCRIIKALQDHDRCRRDCKA